MIAAFDASAFVKLLVNEPGSDHALRIRDGASVFASTLAYPETKAALAAAVRGGRLTKRNHDLARDEFRREWLDVETVGVGQGIAADAGGLAERFPLSGADAVHLATALAIGEDRIVLATWDRRLSEAARSCGLAVVP